MHRIAIGFLFVLCLIDVGCGQRPGEIEFEKAHGVTRANFFRARRDVFKECRACNSGLTRLPGLHRAYTFCTACRGCNRVLQESNLESVLKAHAHHAAPRLANGNTINVESVRQLCRDVPLTYSPNQSPAPWLEIWSKGPLHDVAKAVGYDGTPKRAMGSVYNRSESRVKFSVNSDGVYLAELAARFELSSRTEESLWAWHPDEKGRSGSWLIVVDADVVALAKETKTALGEFERWSSGSRKALREDSDPESSEPSLLLIEKGEREWRTGAYGYLARAEALDHVKSLIAVRRCQVDLGEDPDPVDAEAAYGRVAARSDMRMWEGGDLALRLAEVQRRRIDLLRKASEEIASCRRLIDPSPEEAHERLVNVSRWDVRVPKSEDYRIAMKLCEAKLRSVDTKPASLPSTRPESRSSSQPTESPTSRPSSRPSESPSSRSSTTQGVE